MADEKSKKIWTDAWDEEVHTSDYALKRIKSAQSAKLTPLKIDTTDFHGCFQGSHGRYETSLNYCPCGDFKRSNLPCKHIYRLAIELGLINAKADSNPNAIATPQKEQVSLSQTIDIVEKLSADAQKALLCVARNVRSTTPMYEVDFDNITKELIDSGIIVDTDPQNHKIKFRTKSEMTKLLDEQNIPYDNKAKKKELEDICIKHIPSISARVFGEKALVSIPTKFSATNIHYYLHRKYDNEIYYDEQMNFHKIRLLDSDLPDDAITDQLIARGYCTPKNTSSSCTIGINI